MHRSNNMIGARTANYDVSLFRRYFHISKHTKPGFFRRTLVAVVTALDIKVGVVAYG